MIYTEYLSTKEVIEYLSSKGINSFWHFTDASNLESIKEYGLKSLWEIKRNNIKVNRFGGNALSHTLDYYKKDLLLFKNQNQGIHYMKLQKKKDIKIF
ncbi:MULTISPECIES: hypothetical protein [unclassified Lebetimonas]|uniref:hypothetical protein n=1 Tax=unclassified Lebetimonas TaxID=2648158 RepID=UPI00046682C6|nr:MULTISPECIES: hypothetical protein [unclassified Lebetimonas]